jgi:hypothetical protein
MAATAAALGSLPGNLLPDHGVGIHTAGNGVSGPSGISQYMPIDYIDDHVTSVNTSKQ